MPFFDTLSSMHDAPATELSAGVEEGAAEAEATAVARYVSDIVSENRSDYFKRSLRDLKPALRKGVPAHIAVYYRVVEEDSQGFVVDHRPVFVDGKPLREYRFLITQAQQPQNERFSIMGTFGEDPDFVMTFGEEPKFWTFSGVLRNEEGRGAWYKAFDVLYRERLRASRMVQNREIMVLRLGDLVVEGYMVNFNVSQDGQNDDAMVPFTFTVYVRRYRFVGGSEQYVPASEISQ